MAKSRTGGLIKNYRDHNGMLNDAVLAALAHIVESSTPAEEEAAEPRIAGVEEKPKIASPS
jgi:hypothetical protein